MTRVFERQTTAGGVRMLIVGAGAYPKVSFSAAKVPVLPAISSAARSALSLASFAISSWADRFVKPLASVDLLVNLPHQTMGASFSNGSAESVQLAEPSLAAIKAARDAWLGEAKAEDVLIFYCCGHGIWLPSRGRTFLAADFGDDPEDPWSSAIWLDGLALGLAEKAPREQWLIFDCCANTPTQAMLALGGNPTALVSPQLGGRAQAELTYGPLSQVIVASATAGAQAFGKPARPSRFAEAFIDACEVSGYQVEHQGYWWLDPASLDRAMASYALRIAEPSDELYYKFPRVITTDAAEPPLLMRNDHPSRCTAVVMSEPQSRLVQGDLVIRCGEEIIAQQEAGLRAAARFRHHLEPWRQYSFELSEGGSRSSLEKIAMPPLVKAIFPKGGR